MVDRPPPLTAPEIAEKYGRSLHTVTKLWTRHDAWPPATGIRGRRKTYDAEAVARFVRDHIHRPTPTAALDPRRLYTAREIEAATGIKATSIRADRSKNRWPAPDDVSGRAHRWKGATVTRALATRRGYRKSQED